MRLTIRALLQMAAQVQSCASGKAWDAGAWACADVTRTALPMTGASGYSHGAAHDVTS